MAMFVSGSSSSTGSLARLELYSSAAVGSNVLTVDGTQGRLFSVIDEMSGSIFSANTIAGLPVIEAFSDNTVKLGPFSSPIQIDSSGHTYLNNRLYMSNDLYLLRVGTEMGVGFDNDIAQITYGKDQTDTIHNFYGNKISGSNISTGSFGKLETSGDVQTGGTFMASDGSVGLTTTKEYETEDDYHVVTLKDGLITGWDISAK